MWFLETSVGRAFRQAQAAGIVPTAEQQSQLEARFGLFDGGGGVTADRILTVAGDQAEIRITGVLTATPSFMAMFMGGGNTLYAEIVAALAEAGNNDAVAEAAIIVDSAGGSIDGLFDTLAAVESFSKPLKARVVNMAASAAYALVANADSIEAGNRAVRIGSIGVAASFYSDEREVVITSTDAPNKRPDVTTEEGQAVVREELDALHNLFTESIAAGRGTTQENIRANYGHGATLLADAALKNGMIDSIAETSLRIVKPTQTNGPETKTMDLSILKAEHPAVYALAKQDGVAEERDRVTAHLTMGEASGDMKTAVGAIREGTQMTAAVNATYLAAGMNRSDTEKRLSDDAAAAAAANGADTSAGDAVVDMVVDMVATNLGYTGD